MKRGLEWYKRQPRSWLDGIRAARMTERQAAIYGIIVDLIYDGAGETPDDPKHIASYLSNVGQAAVRTTIQQLIDMGKLWRVDGMLHQKRAENEAQTRRNLSETRAEIGRLGGISSGNSRRRSSENNDLGEANASSKHEADKRRVREEEGGGDSAGASAGPRPSPDFRTRILGAMGIGPDGVVGPSRFIGSQADMAEAARWLSLPGMTEDIVVREISQVCAAKRDGPPTRFRYFTGSMERLSAELTAPPLQPADISQHRRPTHGQPSAARAFDTAINRLADGIAAGTVNIDTRGSDPWEYARRQGGS
jgi:hypothetical protein